MFPYLLQEQLDRILVGRVTVDVSGPKLIKRDIINTQYVQNESYHLLVLLVRQLSFLEYLCDHRRTMPKARWLRGRC